MTYKEFIKVLKSLRALYKAYGNYRKRHIYDEFRSDCECFLKRNENPLNFTAFFTWCETKEGYDYWNNIYETMKKYFKK